MESSQARDRTCVPNIGRQIPNYCTTGKIPSMLQSERSELSTCVPLNQETVGPTFTHPGPLQFILLKHRVQIEQHLPALPPAGVQHPEVARRLGEVEVVGMQRTQAWALYLPTIRLLPDRQGDQLTDALIREVSISRFQVAFIRL